MTCEEYSKKLRDLLTYKKRVSIGDVELLRVGRHFRLGKNKIIVGRNEAENKFLTMHRSPSDFCFELPDVVGPVTLLQDQNPRKQLSGQLSLPRTILTLKPKRPR